MRRIMRIIFFGVPSPQICVTLLVIYRDQLLVRGMVLGLAAQYGP